MYTRHGAGTLFPTLQPYHNKNIPTTSLMDVNIPWCTRRYNLSICLLAQLLAGTGVVVRAFFWLHCWSLIRIFISDGRPHPNVLSIWGAIWEFVQISLSERDHRLFALSHPCRSIWYHMCWRRKAEQTSENKFFSIRWHMQKRNEKKEKKRNSKDWLILLFQCKVTKNTKCISYHLVAQMVEQVINSNHATVVSWGKTLHPLNLNVYVY